MENVYVEKYRRESQILHPVNHVLNDTFIEKDLGNLRSHLFRIQGAPGKNGEYYDPGAGESYPGDRGKERGFTPCRLSHLNDQLKEVEANWQQYIEERLRIGDRKPTEMPDRLKERKERLLAQQLVALEEVEKLKRLIETAEEKEAERKGKHLLSDPRHWSSGQLRDGQLVQIGPWKVAPDEDGLLRISDPSSPYDSLEIWKFRSQVVRPMYQEYKRRREQETRRAKDEDRMCGAVPYPKPPKWDKTTGQLEYEGYDNRIIEKIKQET